MTSRERLMTIFRGQAPDRPAVKLWGLSPNQKMVHPAYQPVYERAMEVTDLMVGAGSAFNLHWGTAAGRIAKDEQVPTASPEWVEVVTRIQTPEGPLRSVFTRSTVNKPGYQKEYLLKEPDDIKKVLSVPYETHPFSADSFHATEKTVGDGGVVMFGLDHAMYEVN